MVRTSTRRKSPCDILPQLNIGSPCHTKQEDVKNLTDDCWRPLSACLHIHSWLQLWSFVLGFNQFNILIWNLHSRPQREESKIPFNSEWLWTLKPLAAQKGNPKHPAAWQPCIYQPHSRPLKEISINWPTCTNIITLRGAKITFDILIKVL